MKTWEMIKELTENPKAKAKEVNSPNDQGHDTVSVVENRICWGGDSCFPLYILVDGKEVSEWELIPQEVTWQDALQAWVDGKTIRSETNCTGCTYHSNSHTDIPKSEIQFGKWYIL